MSLPSRSASPWGLPVWSRRCGFHTSRSQAGGEVGTKRVNTSALKARGFTLVEVTLAIGIISFAFVAMFGMLPIGLNVSRQAMDTTIEAQIVQQLKTQALQTDFSQLETLDQVEAYYFDDQGKSATPTTALYKAAYLPVPQTTHLPASAQTSKLATVTIAVLNTKGSASRAASDLRSASEAKKYTILIPDNGL